MPDNTEIKVGLGKIETKIDGIDTTLSEIRDHLQTQNGRIGKLETCTAVQDEQIETCEKLISEQGKTVKNNAKYIALIVGAIVGIEKVGSWLLG